MSRPRFNRLEQLACLVAIEAAATHQAHQRTHYVRISLIEDIRAELGRRGFDWKAAQARAKAIDADRQAREKAERAYREQALAGGEPAPHAPDLGD